MEYFALAYVNRDEMYVQCNNECKKFWEPAKLLQVPNLPFSSCHSHLIVRGAADFGRPRLRAVARSELFALFLTCFWDAAHLGGQMARGNSQTDIAALFLQFMLLNLDVYKVTMRVMQDEVASVRGRFRTAFSETHEALCQRGNVWKELMDELRELRTLRTKLASECMRHAASEITVSDLQAQGHRIQASSMAMAEFEDAHTRLTK